MTKRILAWTITTAWLAMPVLGESDEQQDVTSGLTSLRGAALSETRPADQFKRILRDRAPIEREYVHQPPLIPHQIRGYEVDLKVNKCMSCHGWKNAAQYGATKVSPTHFETRDGLTLSDVSPRRYFCLQCHVPQADAVPLVNNRFEPVQSLR